MHVRQRAKQALGCEPSNFARGTGVQRAVVTDPTVPIERRLLTPGVARLLLGLSAVFYGSMAVAMRGASHELSPSQIAFARFALNLLMVGVWVFFQPKVLRVTRPRLLFWRGAFGGTAVVLYFTAIANLGAGLGTLLNYTFPLWATLFAWRFLGETISARLLAGMLMATAGLVVVVGPHEISQALQGLGDPLVRLGLAAGLVSSILAGAATTVVRAARRTESAVAVFGAFCLVGAFVSLPGAVADWRPVSSQAAGFLVLVAVLSFGGQMLFTYALRYVGVGAGALTTQMTVLVSYGLAAVTLSEPLGLAVLVGGGLTLAGIFVAAPRKTKVFEPLERIEQPARASADAP